MQYILPLNYFGGIGYFQHLLLPDSVVDVHEHFIKQTGRSRCYILSANGPIQLSVPVSKPYGNKTLTKDVLISYATDWQRTHWKAIESAYASSAFFEDYARDIEQLIFSRKEFLQELDIASIQLVNSWLDLNIKLHLSDRFVEEENCKDHRKALEEPVAVKPYYQLFTAPGNFYEGLSILDLIFSEGPMARNWLKHKIDNQQFK
jgi:hypothetical protein